MVENSHFVTPADTHEHRGMPNTAAAEHNIRLIIVTIITSHMGMAYDVEHHAQSTPPHHGFSQLISVEYACVEHYPCVYCTR